jgi:hypothetical protein
MLCGDLSRWIPSNHPILACGDLPRLHHYARDAHATEMASEIVARQTGNCRSNKGGGTADINHQ